MCDPPSGSTELCLTENTLSGSQIFFFVCLVGVWQRNFEPAVCVYGTTGWELVPSPSYHAHTPQVPNYSAKHRPSTRKKICQPLRVISVKHSSVLPDGGSHMIRNMLE